MPAGPEFPSSCLFGHPCSMVAVPRPVSPMIGFRLTRVLSHPVVGRQFCADPSPGRGLPALVSLATAVRAQWPHFSLRAIVGNHAGIEPIAIVMPVNIVLEVTL